jgi:nucleoside phosphorylase
MKELVIAQPKNSVNNQISLSSVKGKIDFAIITIREDEFEAVLQRFAPEPQYCGDRRYIIGRIDLEGNDYYQVAIARSTDPGEGPAQDLAHNMIEQLAPEWLLVIGIAGGVPHDDFTLGDVVVAKRLLDFSVKAINEGKSPEYDVRGSTHPAVENICAVLPSKRKQLEGEWNSLNSIGRRHPGVQLDQKDNFYGDDEWNKKVKASLEKHFNSPRLPRFTTAVVAATEELVKSSTLVQSWLQNARSVCAVEMELAGVCQAARQVERQYPVLAIRGISDIIGFKRDADWTTYACHSAAAFAYALVKNGFIGMPSKASQTGNFGLPPSDHSKSEQLLNFKIREDFITEIHKIEFVTQSRNQASLDKIFVFPNLKRETGVYEKETLTMDYFWEGEDNLILIKGRELSGKTALARWLFGNLDKVYPTLLLNAEDIHKTRDFEDHLKKEFSKQRFGDFGEWKKLNTKIAIVDNFHRNISTNFIEYLKENFIKIILITDDEEYMLYFKDDPSITNFSLVTIGQFSLAQQEKLIRNWLLLNQNNDFNNIDDLNVDRVENRVNNVITFNRIVPRYPFFILSILQTLELFMPSNIRITAFGHCYQALVTAQLIKKNIKVEDIDSCFNYLKYLAQDIFSKAKLNEIYNQEIYKRFQEVYKSRFNITDALINKINNNDYPILSILSNQVSFQYTYIYYYFMGMYLATEEKGDILNDVFENIHLKENAYILIFTIHHSQDRSLLDDIRLHCLCSFDKLPVAQLTTHETQFMNNLIAELPQSIISDKGIANNRAIQRERKDISDDHINSEEIKQDPEVNLTILELKKGMKLIEILGQILKNRAGSFEKQEVSDILEETIDLGLRMLNLFLADCKKEEFKEWLSKKLQDAEEKLEKEKLRKYDDAQRRDFVERTIQFFGHVLTIGMLNRITDSITSEKIITPLELLSQKRKVPAYDLINFNVQLSQRGINDLRGVPVNEIKNLKSEFFLSNNFWAEKVLSYYVQNYLNTHHMNFQDRQKLFRLLNLKYIPNKNFHQS